MVLRVSEEGYRGPCWGRGDGSNQSSRGNARHWGEMS